MPVITIAGTGFKKEYITYAALNSARKAECVVLRTEKMEAADIFREESIAFGTLDDIYETCEDFAECNRLCADRILALAKEHDVFYGVFDLRDASAGLILQERPDARLIPGVNEEGELLALCGDDVMLLNASDYESFRVDAHHAVLLREIDTRMLASECKLVLSEVYNEEQPVWISTPEGRRQIPLCDIDRLEDSFYSHMLSVAIPAQSDFTKLERFGFEQLRDVVRRLRAPGGCPWDREQTHRSIRQNILEEAYEVADAIDRDDCIDMTEELGDLMLQIVFHSCIGEETGDFSFGDITTGICSKMIFRHPHVFGSASVSDSSEVLDLWQKMKMTEKEQKTTADSMNAVARALPALIRARKVAKRAHAVGFRAATPLESLAHVRKEIEELAKETPGTDRAVEETGDLLFAICAACVHFDIEPEEALEHATAKFIRRFTQMEQNINNSGREITTYTADELEAEWSKVKRSEKL